MSAVDFLHRKASNALDQLYGGVIGRVILLAR
jgi:hypothetical protein